MQEVFHMVDIDGSGTIDLDELYGLFKTCFKPKTRSSSEQPGSANEKEMESRKAFNRLFETVPFGEMNYDEFKNLSQDTGETVKKFRDMIDEFKNNSDSKFFPKQFEFLLKHLQDTCQRNILLNRINDPGETEDPEGDCLHFQELFGMDRTALEEYRTKQAIQVYNQGILWTDPQALLLLRLFIADFSLFFSSRKSGSNSDVRERTREHGFF